MVKGRKEEIFVAFLDIAKAFDRVNRMKLFKVMRRIYEGSMVKFELENVTTGWCKTDSSVWQGCTLSPLLFNIYVGELGKVISSGGKEWSQGKDGRQ